MVAVVVDAGVVVVAVVGAVVSVVIVAFVYVIGVGVVDRIVVFLVYNCGCDDVHVDLIVMSLFSSLFDSMPLLLILFVVSLFLCHLYICVIIAFALCVYCQRCCLYMC